MNQYIAVDRMVIDICYVVSTTQASWFESKRFCENFNMELLWPQDDDELIWIQRLVNIGEYYRWA